MINPEDLRIFQFHKGTIKTSHRIPCPPLSSVFQFHKGTIKTLLPVYYGLVAVFQFHKGTIKTFALPSCSKLCR